MNDTINPLHYQLHPQLQAKDFSTFLPHPLASAFEYISRHDLKGGVEDLRKAEWWLFEAIQHNRKLAFTPKPKKWKKKCRKWLTCFHDPEQKILGFILSAGTADNYFDRDVWIRLALHRLDLLISGD